MVNKKSSLGRGLASILGGNISNIPIKEINNNKESTPQSVGVTNEILITQIETNPFQPRAEFNQEKLDELAASIEQLGIIQPITVRKMNHNKYQLISGERRFRASQIAGLEKLPAFVRVANDQEMLEMALVENIQRENLNPIEVAISYKRLIEEIKLTQEQCSERVGKNRSTITNFLRLLKLPYEIQEGLKEGAISNGHAKALLSIKNTETQINLFYDTVANGYSVRELEQMAKDFSGKTFKRTSKVKNINTTNPLPFSQQKMMHDLSRNLEKDVELKRNKKGKGKLIIPFSNDDDLARIFEIINK
jgi:ParB family chromosome partitioning protein